MIRKQAGQLLVASINQPKGEAWIIQLYSLLESLQRFKKYLRVLGSELRMPGEIDQWIANSISTRAD